MKMASSPRAFLLLGLLFSVAVLISARQLAETVEKTESVEESKYHGHGDHGWHSGGDHGHHPPTTERKTLETSDVKPDDYHHHHCCRHHCWHGHCQRTTDRKTQETSDIKPDHGYGGGYEHGHQGGYDYGHHGSYGYGHHHGGHGYQPPQGN